MEFQDIVIAGKINLLQHTYERPHIITDILHLQKARIWPELPDQSLSPAVILRISH